MESSEAVEMRISLNIVFHDLNQKRSANNTSKMKMNHWIKNLTIGIKTVIDGSVQ
jgi:hypothetical protein